ncbi:MAG: hypothetical protein ACREVJ_01650 [Gammaproteobacteria bacterium]
MSQGTPARQEGRLEPAPRVISLLPAATEIVGSLDRRDALVGVSHECDYQCERHAAGDALRDPRVGAAEQRGRFPVASRRVWYTLFQERHLGVKILMSIVTTPGASSL